MKRLKPHARFALCVRTNGAEDLEQRKLYQVLPDPAARRDGFLRIVDESGEDYLYPAEYFVTVNLPTAVIRELVPASQRPARVPRSPDKLRVRAARG